MHDRDTALLARTAAALRAQGRLEAADQLDAAVADRVEPERAPASAPGSAPGSSSGPAPGSASGSSPAADLDGVRSGTFVLRGENAADRA